jgi:16S rRNA (uracil1498-N3)-methyltransferase
MEHLPHERHAELFLEGAEFHHFLHVMRNVPGNEIELFDGKGTLARAQVKSIEKKGAFLTVLEASRSPPPSFTTILAQAIPRFNRLEWILEKGTELGMTELWLFPAAYSEKKAFTDNQLERMDSIIIASMKQCGRLYRPLLSIKQPISQWVAPTFPCFYGDIDPSAPPFHNIWQGLQPSQGAVFFVGPESGFSDQEIASLHQLGAVGVKLHENILRTETAAISALSLMTHFVLTIPKDYCADDVQTVF